MLSFSDGRSRIFQIQYDNIEKDIFGGRYCDIDIKKRLFGL